MPSADYKRGFDEGYVVAVKKMTALVQKQPICPQHSEPYQELWVGEWMCESCYLMSFHTQDDQAN